MFLVVGLGNPGGRYERTRHNAGFLVVDRLAERWRAPLDKRQFDALVGKGQFRDHPVVLCKPQSFMNLSGHPVASLRGYYKADVANVVVIHDEVDLPLGRVRMKRGGGHGGHNGLKDIDLKLGTPNYIRVRMGVSRPPPGWDTADWVLGNFPGADQDLVEKCIDLTADAVESVLTLGLEASMNAIHARDLSLPPVKAGGPGA